MNYSCLKLFQRNTLYKSYSSEAEANDPVNGLLQKIKIKIKEMRVSIEKRRSIFLKFKTMEFKYGEASNT